MSKEVKARIRLQVPGGAATPAPPVGAVLGQQGVNIMEFCKQFNARTADKKGQTVPVLLTIYKNKTFDFITKTPATTQLIKKKINLVKGSSKPDVNKVGKISIKDIQEIAKIKMPDLNTADLKQAEKIITGSARSMGLEVVE